MHAKVTQKRSVVFQLKYCGYTNKYIHAYLHRASSSTILIFIKPVAGADPGF